MDDRFEVEVIHNGEEERYHWRTYRDVIAELARLREGDQMVISHAGFAEPGAIYFDPEEEKA
jgi:hypothetical protein